jgi:DNA-binding Lrp family transcriptional regulator
MKLSMDDRRLIEATQAGLPLVSEPYAQIAKTLGMSTEWVQDRLSQMQADGLIRRIGAVPNHFKLGFTANGMSVWDVADDQVDALGEQIGSLPGVSHCYRRPRYPGVWSYNLLCCTVGVAKKSNHRQSKCARCWEKLAARTRFCIPAAFLKKQGCV